MSGVFKAIGKVFSAVVGVIKKIWKPILIAAAIYFTAGLALSAMPATASFAAAMPGFAGGGFLGLGVGAGSVAGTGLFTHLAATLGLATLGSSGGLVGGALAGGTTAAELGAAGISGATIAAGGSAAVSSGAISAVALPAEGAGSVVAGGGAATAAGGGAAAAGAATKMTLAEKFLVASTASNVLGGLAAPSPKDIAEAQKMWVGSFYGTDAAGKGPSGPTGLSASAAAPGASPLIPLSSDASAAPAMPSTTPTAIPGTTIAPKNKVPDRTQQARQSMVAQAAGVQQTVSQPSPYGKQSLIPTTDAPFEAVNPGSYGQLDALA